jgi:hypothetical protein
MELELTSVKKVSEYEKHVEECLELARSATSDEHRKMLWSMAETWQALADERRRRQTKAGEKTEQTEN